MSSEPPSSVRLPRRPWVPSPVASLDTLDIIRAPNTMVRPGKFCPSAADARLLEVEVALDAAHDLGADLTPVAQGEDGVPLRSYQRPAPVSPGGGALRVLLGSAASLDAGLVAPDAALVV